MDSRRIWREERGERKVLVQGLTLACLRWEVLITAVPFHTYCVGKKRSEALALFQQGKGLGAFLLLPVRTITVIIAFPVGQFWCPVWVSQGHFPTQVGYGL